MTPQFDNSYARLPDRFFARTNPTPVGNPGLIAVNAGLARELGLDTDWLTSSDGIAALAGNAVPDGAEPLSQAYAGHQFGGWVPQLGDGRAVLLGEVIDSNGIRRDIQLKGSGRTPFSRGGDGRAWIGPVIREYVMSEAMHALGIPTTRALAAVTTGEVIHRERALPGAVLTRVASSHIRVGTFQYFAARKDVEALQALAHHVIQRHYPDAASALELLEHVIARQAKLIAHWASVGFIHGVMNTDNAHIAGETIDYGPCAFMDEYHPDTVYSSIDQFGRYAYSNQPNIAVWNMAQLATALLPLIDEDMDTAVEKATQAVHRFPDIFHTAWLDLFRAKIGLTGAETGDKALIDGLLTRMATVKADFTNTFRALAEGRGAQAFPDAVAFESWAPDWQARLSRETGDPQALMRATNPAVIPRNHRVEEVIEAALGDDFAPFHSLNSVLATPFELRPKNGAYANPPKPEQVVHQTFCGT